MMECIALSLKVNLGFERFSDWMQDFIWYDQQGNGRGGEGMKTGLNAGGCAANSLIKKEKRTVVYYRCTLKQALSIKKERPQALWSIR
ncbi:hypothetical protein [Aeromonas dhakensis]|uniref:hypothetical protein n=1 Tax=Aeromonas dhakensis TaxID=196024 RepID=UPI003BA2BFCF